MAEEFGMKEETIAAFKKRISELREELKLD